MTDFGVCTHGPGATGTPAAEVDNLFLNKARGPLVSVTLSGANVDEQRLLSRNQLSRTLKLKGRPTTTSFNPRWTL